MSNQIAYRIMMEMLELHSIAVKAVEAARTLYGPIEDPDGEPCEGTCALCVFQDALHDYDELKDRIPHKD